MSRRRLATARRRTVTAPPADATFPTEVTGLVNRWRADSIAAANGSAVASWAALTGGVALTAAGTAQPTYITAGINGKPVVRFDGTTDRLDATVTDRMQPVSVMVVAKLASTAVSGMLYNAEGVELYAEGGRWIGWGGAALDGGAATTSASTIIFVANGASSAVNVNGTQVAGNAGSTGHNAPINVGDYSQGGYRLGGDIAEIAVYSRALTASDITALRAYTVAQYGV